MSVPSSGGAKHRYPVSPANCYRIDPITWRYTRQAPLNTMRPNDGKLDYCA